MHSSERALLESCSRTSILSLQGIYSTPLNVLSSTLLSLQVVQSTPLNVLSYDTSLRLEV